MAYLDLLIDTCTIQRFTEGAADDYGNPVLTWANHLVDEPCRLTPISGQEVKVGAELVLADHIIFLGDISITERDRVTIGTTIYEILVVKDRWNGVGAHHKECLLREVK